MTVTFHLITSAVSVLAICLFMALVAGGVYIACHKAKTWKQALPGVALFAIALFLFLAWMDISILFGDWLRIQLDIPCYQKIRCL